MFMNASIILALSSSLVGQNPPVGQDIVGTWVAVKNTDGGRVEFSATFDKDGRMNRRIASKAGVTMAIGRYQIDETNLIMTLEENGKVSTATVQIKELTANTLVLSDGNQGLFFKRRN